MAKKKKIIIDGKEYDLSEFDDTRGWNKEKKQSIKTKPISSLPNILGRV